MFIIPVSLPFLAIVAILITFGVTLGPVVLPFLLIAFFFYVIYDNIQYRRKKKGDDR